GIGKHDKSVLHILASSLVFKERKLQRLTEEKEKRSLPPAFKNDEYEVREAAGTMDPLTPNRVAFPGARSRPAALPKPIIISVPRPHCWKGSASKPYVELSPHTAPLGMEVGPSQACAVKVVVNEKDI
nr:pentatricopeptide repeat-containing protein [Tanacetum cinerariifolium]